jgi:hypothetical protein
MCTGDKKSSSGKFECERLVFQGSVYAQYSVLLGVQTDTNRCRFLDQQRDGSNFTLLGFVML